MTINTTNPFYPSAKVLADSLSSTGSRLTTMEVTFHRYVLAEFNKHRAFSNSAASSRAIPAAKLIAKAQESCVEPLHWGKNQSGMSAREELTGQELAYAKQAWNIARARAIDVALAMVETNVHKQVVNRVIETFLPVTLVVTGDERAYANFFSQRCHPDAQPEMQALAFAMQHEYNTNEPKPVVEGDWHLPFYSRDLAEIPLVDCVKACVARCARVSYNNHHGERKLSDDLALFDKLVSASPPHLTPFEHVVLVGHSGHVLIPAITKDTIVIRDRGNLCYPWVQLRKVYEVMRHNS